MKNNSLFLIAILAATALSSGNAALAACPGTVANGETVSGGCTLVGAGDNAIVQQGGTITNNAGRGIFVGNTTVGSINNSGLIEGSSQAIRQIGDAGIINSITNNQGGHIKAANATIDIDGGAIQNGIINNGRIEAGQTGIRIFKADIFANGIALGQNSNITGTRGVEIVAGGNPPDVGTVTGNLVNDGIINTTTASILINSMTLNGDITNGATGRITANTEHGIWLRNEAQAGVLARVGNISNAGIITANAADGDGIRLEAAVVSGSILNTGTITAGATTGHGIRVGDGTAVTGDLTNNNAINSGGTALYVGENSSVRSITNGPGGTLTTTVLQGILVKDSAVTNGITNDGTINADSTGIYMQETVAAGSATANAVTNTGGITSTRHNAIHIEGANIATNLINEATGTLTANGNLAFNSSGILLSHGARVGGNLENRGKIDANDGIVVGDSANGIATVVGDVINANEIKARSNGMVFGAGAQVGNVTNAATGSIIAAGHCIRFTNASGANPAVTNVTNAGSIVTTNGGLGISLDTVTVGGAVLNSGTIHADSDGIDIHDSTTVANNVTNSNTIISTNGNGIRINGSTVTGTILNANGASITASNGSAFMINNSATGAITNNGTLRGNYAINISDIANFRDFHNTGTLDGAIKIERTTLNLNAGSVASGTIGGANGTVNINTDISTAASYGVADGQLAQINVGNGRTFTAQSGAAQTFRTTSFTNNGTLRIVGNPTASAITTVTGDYRQTATGLLHIDAQLPTVHSALRVGGTANLDPNAAIHLNITGNEFDFSGGAVVQDVISATTLTATTFNVTDSSYLYNFNAVIDGQTVDLQSVRDATKSVTGSVNSTSPNSPNKGAAQAIENIIINSPGGEMNSVINAFGVLKTSQEVADAVSQTMPTLTGGSTTAVLQTMGATGQVIQARNSQNTGLSSGDDTIGDDNVWIKPFGTWSNQGQDDGVVGYDADTYGVVGGIDGDVSDDVRLGVALSYANTSVKSDDARNKLDVDSFQASTYGSYAVGDNTEANFQVGAGYNQTDSKRVLNFGGLNRVAEGDIDGYSVQAGAGIGHSIDIGPGTTFTPSARVDYNLMHNGSYTETDAGGLNLKVRSQTTDQLIPAVSGKLDYEYVEGLSLSLNAGVGYDVLNERNSVTASFVGGGPAFVTQGIEASPWVVRTGVGLTYNATDDLDVTVRYDREDRGEFDAQTASIRLRAQF